MTNKNQKSKRKDSIDHDEELKCYNQASFAFIVVLLTIGVPLWYETTKVYRANLPYEEISSLNETLHLFLKFRVNLLVVDESIFSDVKALQKSAEGNFSKIDIHNRLTVEFAFSTQSLVAESRDTLFRTKNIDQFDKNFANYQLIDHGLNVIIIDGQNRFTTNFDLFLGRRNIFYCRWEFCRENLYFILLDIFISRENLIDICVKHFDKRILDKNKKTTKKLTDNAKVNHKVAFFPKYSVNLALLFPDYDPKNRSAVENLINFLHDDFGRFSRRLKNLTEINFVSQSLYFVDFDLKPSYNRKLKQYFYNYDDLSQLISSVEPYLTSSLSYINRETLHFLIYSPSKDKSGVVFGNPGDKVENAFIVRNWGGVSIIDLIHGNVETFEDVRSIILSQVRDLLGFYSPKSSKFHIVTTPSALSTWDLRRLSIEAILDYNFECFATLNSITKLLFEITNIVINDHVADSIGNAITSAKKSINGLKSDILDDRTLGVSRQQAEIARYHSEKAFFDESLLSLLYFPDDQKYAIYVPLFLPVLLPVTLSLFFLFKRLCR
uniref:GPI transamidase component PIG-S n=1 Tax=Romanomermis culicivorax TaxID=13658 RepID=A0A915I060_ROMCU